MFPRIHKEITTMKQYKTLSKIDSNNSKYMQSDRERKEQNNTKRYFSLSTVKCSFKATVYWCSQDIDHADDQSIL